MAEAAATITLQLGPGETRGYVDLVGELFGTEGVGTVVLTSESAGRLFATGREFAIFRATDGSVSGTAGQLVPGLRPDQALGSGATFHLIGLRERSVGQALERTNLLAFNPGTTARQLTMRLFDAATGSLEGERSETIPAGEMRQFTRVISLINPGNDGASKRLEDSPSTARSLWSDRGSTSTATR